MTPIGEAVARGGDSAQHDLHRMHDSDTVDITVTDVNTLAAADNQQDTYTEASPQLKFHTSSSMTMPVMHHASY